MKRRQFMAAATIAASGPALPVSASSYPDGPLKAEHRVRTIHLRPHPRGGYLILSDGPDSPRKLIRPEAVDRKFGKGTYLTLSQPDHWEMIDAGWFDRKELFDPAERDCREMWIWQANYRPECEAYDMLANLFGDRIEGFLGGRIPDLGLEFAEHPSTPRFATVKLVREDLIGKLVLAVADQTKWIVIDPKPRSL